MQTSEAALVDLVTRNIVSAAEARARIPGSSEALMAMDKS